MKMTPLTKTCLVLALACAPLLAVASDMPTVEIVGDGCDANFSPVSVVLPLKAIVTPTPSSYSTSVYTWTIFSTPSLPGEIVSLVMDATNASKATFNSNTPGQHIVHLEYDSDSGAAEDYHQVIVMAVLLDTIDANFAPSVEDLDVRYTIESNSYSVPFAKIEVFKNGDSTNPIFKDETITKSGTNILYQWDGMANLGSDNGQYVGPESSPYTVKISISGESDYSLASTVTSTTKVEVASVEVNINASIVTVMNDPGHQEEFSALVKLKKKDGTGSITAIPMYVDFSFSDPAPTNTVVDDSYFYFETGFGFPLGKGNNPRSPYWADHPSAESDSSDSYMLACRGKTITGSGPDQGKAYIYFCPSGVGGDDFILRAAVKDISGGELASAESGAMTVWRQADFDKIYQMDGKTHVSTNGTEAVMQPYFTDAYVDYVMGAINVIAPDKSVKYIGLWKNTPPYQKSWAALQARLASEIPSALEEEAAEDPDDPDYATARDAIKDKAQAWVDRIDGEFMASLEEWEASGGIVEKSCVGIRHYHPKYSPEGGDSVTEPDLWPDWVRVTCYFGYTVNPDEAWGPGFIGLHHAPSRIISVTEDWPAIAETLAHEIGHATVDFFKRDGFGDAWDHSPSGGGGLMDIDSSDSSFSSREINILRGIVP